MNPAMMRLFWESINKAQPQQILHLDDEGLLRWAIERVKERLSLDTNQQHDLSNYISNRLPLIREIAAQG